MDAKPPNPFNAGSPVDPNDFVGRVQELENFSQRLRQTSNGSLASMSVVGGYGIGKTSFLHKCKTITEEQNALVVLFSLNEMDNLSRETLAKILIQRVKEKVYEENILKKLSDEIYKVIQRIKIKHEATEISLGEHSNVICPNLQAALTAAWKSLNKTKSGIVFLIDEARVLEKNRAELLLYLRAVLEQLQINKIPVMIVPAGKLSITGPSGTGFSPLVRTFPPAVLENFSKEECQVFLDKKLIKIGYAIDSSATLDKIYEVTEGHPFVLSAYLSTAYSKLLDGEKILSQQYFTATDIEFTKRILAPFFSRFYDDCGDVNKKILLKIAKTKHGETTLPEISQELNKKPNELSSYIGKLVQDGAIIRIERGKYKLFHHLLSDYVKEKSRFHN